MLSIALASPTALANIQLLAIPNPSDMKTHSPLCFLSRFHCQQRNLERQSTAFLRWDCLEDTDMIYKAWPGYGRGCDGPIELVAQTNGKVVWVFGFLRKTVLEQFRLNIIQDSSPRECNCAIASAGVDHNRLYQERICRKRAKHFFISHRSMKSRKGKWEVAPEANK
ncbi:hypothetical protein CC78DRAFT_619708 [Lojkania enalia]|uniref:Uncharacterized protein n=1 Tax=Lojkania enalia TaxID=147567 RepID=A0A9P4K505_9PLEO|nr:hypothetical protein CC78DRAFT_619708 [Didymosphaeria enalia]